MKSTHGWMWPDHEQHMIKWMDSPKNRIQLNKRWTYQGVKQKLVLRFCTQFRTAVDVGAHVGLWAYNLAHAFDHVHAFEPVAAHRECFEANVTMPNVTLHACALGSEQGMISIKSEHGSSGNSIVNGAGDIPMLRLDEFNLENVDLIKVDVEGFEQNVLIGGEQTIRKWKPTIIVEQKRDMSLRFGIPKMGAVAYLEKGFGYRVVQEYSGDFILTAT